MLKLKALQLGDNVKSRLIHTLELHTASRGGLDGIIAAAVTNLNEKTAELDTDLQQLIESLQESASSKSKDTNEALLTLLSQSGEAAAMPLDARVSVGLFVASDDAVGVDVLRDELPHVHVGHVSGGHRDILRDEGAREVGALVSERWAASVERPEA